MSIAKTFRQIIRDVYASALNAIRVTLVRVVTVPNIINKSAPTKDTEVSQAITDGTTQIFIRSRKTAQLQYSFVTGESGTKFITIPPGASHVIDNGNFVSATIYIQSNKVDDIIEILELN